MTFEEWARRYPARIVQEVPKHHRFKEKTYADAVSTCDWVEQIDEVAAEVVEYNGDFYVIHKD